MKAGIVLSGCGLGDGSQIEEVMLLYLALDKYNIDYIAFAPDRLQYDVVNHFTEEVQDEQRNILIESARIGRGRIMNIKKASVEDLDILIFPGGIGVFKNLSNYMLEKENFKLDEDVDNLIKEFYKNQKPILGICGAIVLIPKSLEDIAKNLKIAISNNAFNELLSKLNVNVTECAADEIVVDKINKVITTPAFLASQNMNVIYAGIEKMINETNNFC